ncbi:MAG: SBBP repeat-containing protein [Chroococcales cyanobacterium]
MEELRLGTTLLTPASDPVFGDPSAIFEFILARAGNDVIYGYDPGVNNESSINIDVLFGDLFDNTEDEILLSLDIVQGNLFAISNTTIPSVGADRFVLGDELQSYYTSSDFLSLLTTDFLGLSQFAIVYDLSVEEDTIQLNGNPEDYFLFEINNLSLPIIGEFSGEVLFSLQQGIPDVVALILSKPEVDLDLSGRYFQFVGNSPQDSPEEPKIAQFGTIGLDFGNGVATDGAGNIYLTGLTSGSLFGTNLGSSDVWLTKYSSNGNQLWAKQLGTPVGDIAYNIVTDNEGNFYLAGAIGVGLNGYAMFAEENLSTVAEAWIAKFDANSNLIWERQVAIDEAVATYGVGLEVDDGNNVYLSGVAIKSKEPQADLDIPVEDDSWVAKFDSKGEQQWLTQINTDFFNESYGLAVDSEGNSYLVGWTQGLVEPSDPSRDFSLKYDPWLTKVNSQGEIEWKRQFGSVDQGVDFAWGVDTDSQNNIYIYGWTTGQLGGNDLGFENDSYDVWLTKFTSAGDPVWAKQIGSPGDDAAFLGDLVIDSSDNIFLTGYTNGQLGDGPSDQDYNAWVGRFNTDGDSIWIRQFGVQGKRDYATRAAVNNSGQLFVTGYTEGFLGTTSTGAQGGAIDAWAAQLSIEDGSLENFGNFDNNITTTDAATVSDSFGGGGADVVIGVDPNTSLAGLGEIDQLQGGGGADLFVLGDENGAYYDDGDPATLGWNDYALIEDFQSSQSDQIQLYGSANDYSLGTNIPTLAQGTAIFFGENYDELIGVVKDVTGLTLDDSSVFTFVA